MIAMRMLVRMLSAVLAIVLQSTGFAAGSIQTAKVTGGEVSGAIENDLSIFKGIPFAAPPVGNSAGKRRSRLCHGRA